MKNYIIGYGSLINFESQNMTGKSYFSIPVVVHDHSRSWSVVYNELQFCALGVYPEKNKNINAVLFEVEDLNVFDQREQGYARFELNSLHLSAWRTQNEIPVDGKIWIYLPFKEKFGSASEKYFIWQSYLDVIFMGCLAVDQKFTDLFIDSTTGWDINFLKNDRADSAYIRALKNYDAKAVDSVLLKIKKQN
jgi:hypothetical protein